jgi:hypothetical protein
LVPAFTEGSTEGTDLRSTDWSTDLRAIGAAWYL